MNWLKNATSFVSVAAAMVLIATTLPTTATAVVIGIPQRVEQLETATSDLDVRVDGLEATAPIQVPDIQAFSSAYVKAYAAPTKVFQFGITLNTGAAPTVAVEVQACNWDGPPDWNPYCPEEPSDETATLAVPFTPDNTGPYTFDSGTEFDTLAELVTNGEHGHVNIWGYPVGYSIYKGGDVLDESAVFAGYMAPGEYDLMNRYTLHSVILVVDEFSPRSDGGYDVRGRAIFRIEPVSE